MAANTPPCSIQNTVTAPHLDTDTQTEHWIGFNKAVEDKTLERRGHICGVFMRPTVRLLFTLGWWSAVEGTFPQVPQHFLKSIFQLLVFQLSAT